LLHATCLERAGRALEGRQIFEKARTSVFASGCNELIFEFEFYDALADWNLGDFDGTKSKLLSSLESITTASDPNYTLSLGVLRSRSTQFISNVHSVKEQYEDEARVLGEALAEYDKASRPDVYTQSFILMNYSSIVRELGAEDSESIRARYRSITWTPFLAPHSFHIMRSFGWFNALRGDHLGAFRDLREAGSIAKTPTLALMAILDRALLAQGLNEQLTAREELERAQDIAARTDWNAVTSDERIGLLMLAQALARVKPRAARVALDRFQAIETKIATTHVVRFDRRLKAEEFYAAGLVAKSEGSTGEALEALVQAFDIWASIGYRWRAALAAIELADLTHDSRYTGFAAAEAMKHPASWLAQRFANRDASVGYSSLP
jgi:tetratricopeptide (TPR) repeat protein